MDRFAKFHPAVCFLFFLFVFVLTPVFINPVFGAISFAAAFFYELKACGKTAALGTVKFALPLSVLVAVFNMLFCRYGKTTLFSVFEIKMNLEPLVYGVCTGLMLGALIMWFASYNEVVTSEKIAALFGGFAPSLVLTFSMAMRFVPLMVKTANQIKEAQQGLGNEIKGVKNGVARFSALVSMSLERSMEISDSMRARGFGKGKHRGFSRYEFRAGDAVLMCCFTAAFVFEIIMRCAGAFEFLYQSRIEIKSANPVVAAVFAAVCFLPLAVDVWEDAKWLILKSKI